MVSLNGISPESIFLVAPAALLLAPLSLWSYLSSVQVFCYCGAGTPGRQAGRQGSQAQVDCAVSLMMTEHCLCSSHWGGCTACTLLACVYLKQCQHTGHTAMHVSSGDLIGAGCFNTHRSISR